MADLYKTAGADRIVTVDLHTDQIQGFFDGPVDHMRAQSLLCGYIAEHYVSNGEDVVVVSPDSGRVRVAEKWADSLVGCRWPSSTRPVTRECPIRSRPIASLAT